MSLCRTVNLGSVGESGFQSVVGHVVSGPGSKIMVVRAVRSSLCGNTGVFALLVANGITVASGDITSVGSAIQAQVAAGTRVTAVVHTFPLNNGIVCTRLGELEYEFRECKLEYLQAGSSAGPKETTSAEAESLEDASISVFGTVAGAATAGYTSHFNFDYRVFSNDPNPPTTNKYCCMVECVYVDGSSSWLHDNDTACVYVGELDVLQIDALRRRVVRCRFCWRINGQQYTSDWVVADPGSYIVYAFLVWHGVNDYERPIYFYQEPIV